MTTVGSIVLATKSGLGVLAKTLYESNIIDKVYIAEHKIYDSHPEWYEKEDVCLSKKELLDSIDTLFLLEAPMPDPFDWSIVRLAVNMGKKVVLMPMYESTPRSDLVFVDKIICPSELDLKYYEDYDACFIEVPVSKDIVWRQRTKATRFVHNVGHGGIFSRNGTSEIIKALPLIKSPIELTIRIQPDAKDELTDLVGNIQDSRVVVQQEHIPFEDLWKEGDVFLFPEKFNGLSLPLQEAHASGMLVMAGDRFPVNTWLPQYPLIPVNNFFSTSIPWIGIKVNNAIIEPKDIADTIDRWYDQDITNYSLQGKYFKEKMSGEQLKPKYDKILR